MLGGLEYFAGPACRVSPRRGLKALCVCYQFVEGIIHGF
jgi:hypothetical protein